jgi:hypothetical protein
MKQIICLQMEMINMQCPDDVLQSLAQPWQESQDRRCIAGLVTQAWGLPAILPQLAPSVFEGGKWPTIHAIIDLSQDPFYPVLREDVALWFRKRGPSRGFVGLSYEPRNVRPIRILVSDQAAADLWGRILVVSSDELKQSGVRTELPQNLAEPVVFGTPRFHNDHEAPSANNATIGAWVKIEESSDPSSNSAASSENKRVGITCNHVACTLIQSGTIRKIGGITEPDADIALVELVACPADIDACGSVRWLPRNPLHFLPPDDLDAALLIEGRPVYKCGAATGYTEGTLVSPNYTSGGEGDKIYKNAVLVKWSASDSLPFAISEDCGALYCIRINKGYVPIAMHVNSFAVGSEQYSVGLRFADKLEVLAGGKSWEFETNVAVPATNASRLAAMKHFQASGHPEETH